MASFHQDIPLEGGSTNRPPFFNGIDYPYWKTRMQIFLESVDLKIWYSVEEGYQPPTTLDDNGKIVPKKHTDFTRDELEKAQYNSKAKNLIVNALGKDEYYRVSSCKTAREMWLILETTHEGTSEVKRSKQNALSREFELFEMHEGESIFDMQKRFMHIVTSMNALNIFHDDELLVNKILRCLTKEWDAKTSAIYEAKDLSTMSIATLFGKLQEYELELNRRANRELNKKKQKGLALKVSSSHSKESKESTDTSSSDSSSGEDDEMTMFVKKFNKSFTKFFNKKFNKRRRRDVGQRRKDNNSSNANSNNACFECGKEGHFQKDCPNKKNKYDNGKFKKGKGKKKKKAYMAFSDDSSSSSSSSSSEKANLCLMANLEDEHTEVYSCHSSNSLCDSSSCNNSNSMCDTSSCDTSSMIGPSYDDLLYAYKCLQVENEKLTSKVEKIKKEKNNLQNNVDSLTTIVNDLMKDNEDLKNENLFMNCLVGSCDDVNPPSTIPCAKCVELSNEVDRLKIMVDRMTSGRDNLNVLLGRQRVESTKYGLGFQKPPFVQPRKTNHYPPRFMSKLPFKKCTYCCMSGHLVYQCNIKKYGLKGTNLKWVPKRTINVSNIASTSYGPQPNTSSMFFSPKVKNMIYVPKKT
ncbi:uncharacterized protein LOC133314843 [Gastrolobium bilobum]|uniref:uncharacterized protein LOC133314843 n=1 Tax=Gastrolobium bilobum TaxID=150636 RepID=UPI002AB06077|nr:uncharacterized protein LOC133314843 [Gastrolobium bilobum]